MGILNYWDTRNRITAGTLLPLVGLMALPLAALLWSLQVDPIQPETGPTHFLRLLLSSIGLALRTAIIATGFAWALAFILVRTNMPARLLLLLVAYLPFFVPSYIHVWIWSRLGESISSWLGFGHFDGILATVWVLVLSYYPIALFVLVAAFSRIDQHQVEAARQYGTPLRALVKVHWRYLRPYLALSLVLMFIFSFSDFAVSDFFQVRVYATEVFIQLSAYQSIGGAVQISAPIILIGMVLLYLLMRLIHRVYLGSQSGRGPAKLRYLGQARIPLFTLVLVVLVAVVVYPVFFLASRVTGWSVFVRALRSGWADALAGLGSAAVISVAISGIALLVAYSCQRKLVPAGNWIRWLSLFILVIPNSLVGVGFVAALSGLAIPAGLSLSVAVLMVAQLIVWFPLALEFFILAWVRIPPALEDVAYMTGNRFVSVFRRILMPQLSVPVLSVTLLLLILCFNELTLLVLLGPPGWSTLPARLFSTIHYGPESLIAAYSLLQIVVISVPTLFLLRLGIRRHRHSN